VRGKRGVTLLDQFSGSADGRRFGDELGETSGGGRLIILKLSPQYAD
jgi:hypothetical protein